jgi:hypothetical protein
MMFNTPQPSFLAISATPIAVIRKTNFTATLLRKVTERLLTQRVIFEVFNARRGATFSHNAIIKKTTVKLPNLIIISLSIRNIFIDGLVIYYEIENDK